MDNLAQALSGQGKYAEAERMHREELVLGEKVLGKGQPDTLTCMSNLAMSGRRGPRIYVSICERHTVYRAERLQAHPC